MYQLLCNFFKIFLATKLSHQIKFYLQNCTKLLRKVATCATGFSDIGNDFIKYSDIGPGNFSYATRPFKKKRHLPWGHPSSSTVKGPSILWPWYGDQCHCHKVSGALGHFRHDLDLCIPNDLWARGAVPITGWYWLKIPIFVCVYLGFTGADTK